MSLSKREVIYPRLALLCLSLLVVLTLCLFVIGLITLQGKRADALGLELSTVKLQEERVAAELNRQSWQQAEAALGDKGFEELIRLEKRPASVARDREIRKVSADIRERHPIVAQVLTVVDGRLRRPTRLDRGFRQAVENRFAIAEVGRTGADVLSAGAEPRQVFFRLAGNRTGRGFVADEKFIAGIVLPQIARSVVVNETTARHFRLTKGLVSEQNEVSELATQLTGIFPFMRLEIAESPIQRQQAKAVRETVYLIVSCLMFLSVVGAGLVLIVRSIRDLQVKQLRTDVMSAFSHELKTPLTLIRLYAEILQSEDDPPSDNKTRYCEIISRESERLSKLIERLLKARRIEQGDEQYDLVGGNLVTTVTETVNSYAEHLRLRGFTVDVDLAASVPAFKFDPDAVSQAVLNLMDNARKYSGEARYIAVRLFRNGLEEILLEVEDHGLGIPAEERSKIFEGFYRVSNSPAYQGFGVGLFVVRHIMRAHGGRVEVVSEPGKGSCFRLVFPLSRHARFVGVARNFHPFARSLELARRGLGGR